MVAGSCCAQAQVSDRDRMQPGSEPMSRFDTGCQWLRQQRPDLAAQAGEGGIYRYKFHFCEQKWHLKARARSQLAMRAECKEEDNGMVSRYVRMLLHRLRNGSAGDRAASDQHLATRPAQGVPERHSVADRRDHHRHHLHHHHLSERLIVQVDGTPGFPARGMAGLGVLVRNEQGMVLRWYCGRAPARTSNEAEYQALIAGLRLILRDFQGGSVRCLTDSRLVVDQLCGLAAVRTEPMRSLYHTAQALVAQFPPNAIELVTIPRDLNRLADALAWEALGGRRSLLRRLATAVMLRPVRSDV